MKFLLLTMTGPGNSPVQIPVRADQITALVPCNPSQPNVGCIVLVPGGALPVREDLRSVGVALKKAMDGEFIAIPTVQ